MATIPRESGLDHSLAFLSEGYDFITNRCRKFGSDIFITRLLGKSFYCVRGAEAAAMFYEPDRFTRKKALPTSVLHLLQDEGSVATLDGETHRHRKAMLMSLMVPERLGAIAEMAAEDLREHVRGLVGQGTVVMHDEFRTILCRTACRWAGVELDADELGELTAEIGAMIDNAGAVGPPNWMARVKRRRAERLMTRVVEDVRAGLVHPPQKTAAHIISLHRETGGELLDPEIAAVELLNIVRPTVANARFMTFALLALHRHAGTRSQLAEDDDYLEAFVQEVRRFYPFFPVIAGKARTPFTWRGHRFEAGDMFMLDLYGTCHDEASWDNPMTFRPERFLDWSGDPYTMIPQGGGEHLANHRCAGEWVTIDVMKAMLRTLARDINYDVPEQDLSVDLSQLPALPKSGFCMKVTAVWG